METSEVQEEGEEAEDDASAPMDDEGAEAVASAGGEETNRARVEEVDDGDVTEAENRLLDSSPLQTQSQWIRTPLTPQVRSPKFYRLNTDKHEELSGSLFTKEFPFDL